MPPAWMWPLDDELEDWFAEVEERRRERFGGSSGAGRDDDRTDGPGWVQNSMTKGMRGR